MLPCQDACAPDIESLGAIPGPPSSSDPSDGPTRNFRHPSDGWHIGLAVQPRSQVDPAGWTRWMPTSSDVGGRCEGHNPWMEERLRTTCRGRDNLSVERVATHEDGRYFLQTSPRLELRDA